MDFWTAVQTCFRKYATFQGRARRSEFWYFWLFLILGNAVGGILDAALGTDLETGSGVVGGIFSLVTLIPMFAATARRLHDTNRSGWWQIAYVVPAFVAGFGAATDSVALMSVGGIAMVATLVMVLIWLVRAGDRGPNRFGPDPMGPPVVAQPYAQPGGGAWR